MELIRKNIDFAIKQVGEPEDRILEFIGSTADVDRYGDIIAVEGWDLKNYQKNPVFLWAHDYQQPPVGKAVKVDKTDQGLLFQVQFPTAEQYAFADTIYKLYLGGYLQATSVGFRDVEREAIVNKEGERTGWKYTKQELYELSAVPVPANPNAVMMAVQKGVINQEEAQRLEISQPQTRQTAPSNDLDLPPRGQQDHEPHVSPEDKPRLIKVKPRLTALGIDASPDNPWELVEQLCTRAEHLQSRVQELESRVSLTVTPEQIKTALQEALQELHENQKDHLTDYYSLALTPGPEPHGERPAEDDHITAIMRQTEQIHQLFCRKE